MAHRATTDSRIPAAQQDRLPVAGRATPRGWILAAIAAILLAGFAAYSDSFRGVFVFDDKAFIDEPAAQNLWPPWRILAAPRPVVEFTLALNYSLGGPRERGYHAFNLAVHLLAALTLFGIVRRTLMLPSLAPRFGRFSTAVAFCIGLLWVLHPLQTESVTYIIQRMESLMGLFYLLTLYCFIRAAGTNQLAVGNWCVAAVAACALGMGSKEVMVTAPLVVLLYDRTFIAGSFGAALRRRWGFYLALAGTWVILVRQIIEAFAPKGTSAGFNITGISALDYAASQPGVILRYLELSFWPSGLCLDYGWPVAKSASDILPGAIVVGGLLAVTVWALVRRPAWGFIGACFFLVLAPTSSIMPIRDLAFEHRMYLPLAAVISAAVVAASLLVRNPPLRVAAIAVTFAAAAALGLATFDRNKVYQSGISVWWDTKEKRPENPRAWNNLSDAYCSEHKFERALAPCDRAIALRKNYPEAYYNRGNAYAYLDRLEDAVADYTQAITLRPDYAGAHNNRANVYTRMGRYEDAIGDYDEAIRVRRDFVLAWCNRGIAHEHVGRDELALRDYDKAIEVKPDYADAYNNRAGVYSRMGRDEDALRDYDRAIRFNPDFAEAYNNRGNVRLHFRSAAQAIEDYDKAIALKSDYAEAYFNRGNAWWFGMNRGDHALSDYSRAIELDRAEADAYGYRAEVYYQMKAYDKALADVQTCQKLGGKPSPAFLKALHEAAGRAE